MSSDSPDRDGILATLKGWIHPTHGLLLFAVLVAIRLWSLYAVPEHSSWIQLNRFALVSIIGLTAYFVVVGKRSTIPRSFGWSVGIFLGCQILTIVPAWYVHDQSPKLSVTGSLFIYFWLTYFLLHYLHIPPRRVLLTMLGVGLVWAGINTVQQFTYPRFLFFSRLDDFGEIEIRAGVRRFMIYGSVFGTFSLFFFFNQILHRGRLVHWLGFLAMMSGVYYYGTRQVTFTSLFVVFLIAVQFAHYRRFRFSPRILGLGLVFVLAAGVLAEPLLGKLVSMTTSQPSNAPDFRAMSYRWYGLEYWDHWLCYIMGNGMADSRSAFGREIMSFQAMGMYQVDIGIVGAWSMYGAIFVIGVVATFLRAILLPQTEGTIFLRAFFLFAFFNLSVNTFFPEGESFTFYSFIFYLLDHQLHQARTRADLPVPADSAPSPNPPISPWHSFRRISR